MFTGDSSTLGGVAGNLSAFATAMAALSVASERVTETVKQWLNPMEKERRLSWLASDWFTQLVAILSGILVVALSGTDPIGSLGLSSSHLNLPHVGWGLTKWFPLIMAGILVSGGSATWNHILDILKAAKVQKETDANKNLPAGEPAISS